MKKRRIALVLTALLFSGCASGSLGIEHNSWSMTVALSGETGSVLCCAPSLSGQYPAAEELSMTCQAEEGQLLFTLEDGGTSFAAQYKEMEHSQDGTVLYQVLWENGSSGQGVVSYTEGDSGEKTPTLVLTLPDSTTVDFAAQDG